MGTRAMDSTKICSKCGHQTQMLTRICSACGQMFDVNQVRAFAIVEGTAGVGKSTLVNQMVKAHVSAHPSLNTLLCLGQEHTYAPLDPDNINHIATEQTNTAYLARIYDTLSFLSHPSGTPGKLVCIIETLHLTLAFRPGVLAQSDILAYDSRLAALGCKLIFIKVSSQAHWERCIWERRNNGFITKYGIKYGKTLEEIHQYYVNEQEKMLELFEQSRMNKLLLDGELPLDRILEMAYSFWIS